MEVREGKSDFKPLNNILMDTKGTNYYSLILVSGYQNSSYPKCGYRYHYEHMTVACRNHQIQAN